MRKVLTAAFAALVGMGVSAQAADIYDGSLKDEPVTYAPYTPAPIWSGLYVGGHAGGFWNDSGDSSLEKRYKNCWGEEWSKWEELDDVQYEDGEDEFSLIGGVHIGYNWQDGARVFGVEGDVSFSDGIDYLASLRARLGYAWEDVLVYATAGVAFAGFEDKTINAKHHGHDHKMDISGEQETGLVVGGGIERKISSNVSIGLEGLYYFFDDAIGSKTFDAHEHNDEIHQMKLTHEDDNDLFVVRARLSYHLQNDEPALEPYK